MENVLDDLQPNEIAAILSVIILNQGFICQFKSKNEQSLYLDLNPKILDAMAHIEEIIEKIAYLEIENHIFFDDVD